MKLIIFDFSGVCFNNAEEEVVSLFAEENSLDSKEVHALHDELIAKAETEEITFRDVWEQMGKHFHVKVSPDEILKRMIARAHPSEKVLELVRFLRNRKYKTAYFTNLNRAWGQAFEKLFPLKDYFDYGIISYTIKARKPSMLGFQNIMHHFNVEPSETVFIDDSVRNLTGAGQAGIHTIHFTNYDQLLDDLENLGVETPETPAEKYRHLLKREWYIQNFNGTMALIHFAGLSGMAPMQKNLGYSYRAFIGCFQNDLVTFYYGKDDLDYVAHNLEERYRQDKEYLKKIMQASYRLEEKGTSFIEKWLPCLKKMSDNELIEKYRECGKLYAEGIGISHMLEGYSLTRDTLLRIQLAKELEREGEQAGLSKYFTALTEPTRNTFVGDYNNALVKIMEYIKKNGKAAVFKDNDEKGINRAIEEDKGLQDLFKWLEKEFYWIKASYREGKAARRSDFIEEIREALNETVEDKEISAERFNQNIAEKNRIIEELNLSEELVEIVRITDTLTYWQDDRKKWILHMCCAMDSFLEEMSVRFNRKQHYLRYLVPEEITLEKVKNLPDSFFEERIKESVIIYENGSAEIFSGSEYREFRSMLEEKEKTAEDPSEIRGMAASGGKAMGKVKICRSVNDINSFKKGEILVTGMTRPEFVPAMAKSAAIVTDEGGITSHAAVIARELGVPCVIGTKIATRVLKDNMLVEVNANHGWVKIIGKGE